MLPVLRVQRLGAFAVEEIFPQVAIAVDSPLRIGHRQLGNPQAFAHAAEHVEQLVLLLVNEVARARPSLLRSRADGGVDALSRSNR